MKEYPLSKAPQEVLSVLPVLAGNGAACREMEGALRQGGLQLLPWAAVDRLGSVMITSQIPRAILLDSAGAWEISWAAQNVLQAHPDWCTVPVVAVNDSSPETVKESAQKPIIPPDVSFSGVPSAEELSAALRSAIVGAEPQIQLRRLERSRLRSNLNLTREMSTIDSTLTNLKRAVKDVAGRLYEAETRMTALRRAQNRLNDVRQPGVAGIDDWVARQAITVDSYRQQIRAFEAERRDLLLRRHHTSKDLQTEIQELDRQIRIISEIIRFSRTLAPP